MINYNLTLEIRAIVKAARYSVRFTAATQNLWREHGFGWGKGKEEEKEEDKQDLSPALTANC